MVADIFRKFISPITEISIPEKFTFPFYYEPHPLAKLASDELVYFLENQKEWEHNFGLKGTSGLGKMFGILVVQREDSELGYIAAYSGKLADQYDLPNFAPFLIDKGGKNDYFQLESDKIAALNEQINCKSNCPDFASIKHQIAQLSDECTLKKSAQKAELKRAKASRKKERELVSDQLSESEFLIFKEKQNQESINDKFLMREYSLYLDEKLKKMRIPLDAKLTEIKRLKDQMKLKSNNLQNWIFAQYNFLNINKEVKNVIDIFKTRIPDIPPSGAGDCAAPKLLQHAFRNNLKPIALAEFWWGKSPSSESRQHRKYYPACRGKCEPILSHMLKGLEIHENPLLTNPALGKKLSVIYEDQHLLVIDKPAEFLSVPGKNITDSVQERMKKKYPDATGPMIVHRLDMSTSGLMVVAKIKEVHEDLQRQFSARRVKKRYLALLEGIVEQDEGFIDLPLRGDQYNRPFQIVCHKHGKSSRTKFEVISRTNSQTRIHFYPITGRTHQLRVHASNQHGLNAPIVGDDLYGTRGKRLHLHAGYLKFVHPVNNELLEFEIGTDF